MSGGQLVQTPAVPRTQYCDSLTAVTASGWKPAGAVGVPVGVDGAAGLPKGPVAVAGVAGELD